MSADIVPAKSKWPKLSEDLTGERSPGLCQCCGATDELQCWMESDESDQPTETMLVLCGHCSGVLIEPHPRLYVCLPYNAPRPGAMRCCTDCTLRRGLECKHPLLKTNGGEGLPIRFSKPQVTFVDGKRNGKNFGYQHVTYFNAPVCTGRQP